MATEPPHRAERELLGRLATRVAGEFEHLFERMAEHLGRIDDVAGDRAEVQDELADGRELLVRGEALLRQLAAFGGQHMLAPERLDLRTEVGSWWPRLQQAIGLDHILELHLRGRPQALIDAEQLTLALENLCVNARDASPVTGDNIETIELHIFVPDDEPDSVALEIVDHGAGMDPATLEQAPLPFFSTMPRHAGLGLPAAQAIVEAHGGRLQLDSVAGEGTTVRLRLPGADPEREPHHSRDRVRVLVVDAERLIVRWMRRSLTSKGCEVRTAAGILAAREALRDDWPELVIVDRLLAEGDDGRSFALELALDYPDRALLFATTEAQLRRDYDRGLPPLPRHVEILDKPFSTRRFDELIGAALARIRAARVEHG